MFLIGMKQFLKPDSPPPTLGVNVRWPIQYDRPGSLKMTNQQQMTDLTLSMTGQGKVAEQKVGQTDIIDWF